MPVYPFTTCTILKMKRVCSSCFADEDLRAWIRDKNGPRGCDACERFDSPTVEFHKLAQRIDECIQRYYGLAVEQLGYCSAEGGYLGSHWDSWDMLDKVGLMLPRDDGTLSDAIAQSITDDFWCDFDAGALEPDRALWSSWEGFCETVKHKRRFFFHATGQDDQDSFTPASLLSHIAGISNNIGLVVEIPIGTEFWRARTKISKGKRMNAADFGPPQVDQALQSNRMNPPGIPMLYLASTVKTALKETKTAQAKVGLWRAARSLRVLDLRALPSVPGMFSDADRTLALTLSFLHDFAADIMKPVERDDRVHVDYLPSQVVTEFMRDYPFEGGVVDGIAYRSTVHRRGWNIALFLGSIDLGLAKPEWGPEPSPSLTFEGAKWATCA
jgi:RES domain-containing protein